MEKVGDKYTTKEKKAADPTSEAGKMELSNDAYATREGIDLVLEKLEQLRLKW